MNTYVGSKEKAFHVGEGAYRKFVIANDTGIGKLICHCAFGVISPYWPDAMLRTVRLGASERQHTWSARS